MHTQSKHVLITGGAKRLGRAIADRLLQEGARLTVHYHTAQPEAQAFEKEAKKRGHEIQCLSADLADPAAPKQIVEKAIAGLGPIDVLINSASLFFPTPAQSATQNAWDELLPCNLTSLFFLCQQVHNTQPKGGVILNLCDVYAERALPGYAIYSATKAGVRQLTRVLAKEWAPHWRVNALSPGPILFPPHYTEEQKQGSIERTLLKRKGEPNEIAAAAKFLIENTYLTGVDLCVDGGRSLSFF
ncbi:MAG: SDR family oxidoreductase [Bdellovibrionales bacterium]|nr:SDR family oxidoreductase [Bdellovibrionales bacterium]